MKPVTNVEMNEILYAYRQADSIEQVDATEWLVRNFIIEYGLEDNAVVTRAQAATVFENMSK